MSHSQKNESQLEKYITARKINTVRKMCLNQKNGSQKNVKQSEKLSQLEKMRQIQKNEHI